MKLLIQFEERDFIMGTREGAGNFLALVLHNVTLDFIRAGGVTNLSINGDVTVSEYHAAQPPMPDSPKLLKGEGA